MKYFFILQNAHGILVAEQAPQVTHTGDYIFVTLLAAGIIFGLYAKMWKIFWTGLLLFIFQFTLLLKPAHPTYRMTLDTSSGLIKTEARRKDAVLSTSYVSKVDISNAQMAFNRGDTRIVIVKVDGSIYYPLGEQYIQDAPEEYVVLNAIQRMIGQVPEPDKSQQH